MEKYTRNEAVEIAGEKFVREAEKDNCEFTNRVTNGTEWHGFDEFVGISSEMENGEYVRAYYYQPVELTSNCMDLGSLDWEIDHYEIY